MARPLNEDRRAALLAAAARVFAEHGLAAPTSLISKTAKVSEGSLFTYFKTKDELTNALYQDLRLDLAAAVMNDFPRRGSVKARLEHIWIQYVTWGAKNPLERKALRLVSMSHLITHEVRAGSTLIFAEVERLRLDAKAQGKLAPLPPQMISQSLKALAEMTMDLIDQRPRDAKRFTAAGFQMLWGALRKP
jgi:AcrR family transcriptional regulator